MLRAIVRAAIPLVLFLSCSRTATPGSGLAPLGKGGGGPSKGPSKELPVLGPRTPGPALLARLGSLGPAEHRTPPPATRRLWVSPAGNDTNDCSEKAPCREIQRVIARGLGPGDVVMLADGDYARFTAESVRGEPDRPITIFATGKRAVVNPDEACTRTKGYCRDNIILRRCRWLVLDGLTSRASPRAGVAVFYGAHVTIRNAMLVDNGRWGVISSFADDLTVEHNEVSGSQAEHGIYLSNSGDRPIIRANVVHDNNYAGIQLNGDYREKPEKDKAGHSYYDGAVDGLITGAMVEDNLIYGNNSGMLGKKKKPGGAAINMDGVQDSVVEGNVLYDNHATGIVAYGDADGIPDDDGEDGDGAWGPKGMLIAHNTVVMPKGARHALQIRLSAGPNVVRNNILYHDDLRRAGLELVTEADQKLVDSDRNVMDRVALGDDVKPLRFWQTLRGKDLHSLSVPFTRLFLDPARGDFRLLSGSPAAQSGAEVQSVQKDLLGKPYPAAGRSIGACQCEAP
jgi:parallel beta-helix repeat protein